MITRPLEAANVVGRIIELLRRQVARATTFLLAWQETEEQRRALLEMDERMLKDIGIRRADALREADRLRWRTCDRDDVRSRS